MSSKRGVDNLPPIKEEVTRIKDQVGGTQVATGHGWMH